MRQKVLLCGNGLMGLNFSNVACWMGSTGTLMDEFFTTVHEMMDIKNERAENSMRE